MITVQWSHVPCSCIILYIIHIIGSVKHNKWQWFVVYLSGPKNIVRRRLAYPATLFKCPWTLGWNDLTFICDFPN